MTAREPTLERFCPLCQRGTNDAVCPHDGVPTVPEELFDEGAPDDAVGRVLGERYRLDSRLAEGGMGRVYRATDLSSGALIAVKLLRAELLGHKKAVARFYREARAVSRLSSPHIVEVHAFGFDEDARSPWLAMELVDGGTLAQRLEDGPLTPPEARRLARDICAALVVASEAGIVHRDLKPSNVALVAEASTGQTCAKVMDFGVARDLAAGDEGTPLTRSGAPVGTPTFMAPEQVTGGEVDPRTDLYALGCVLHTMLTGRPPFGGADPMVVMNRHVGELPTPLADPLPTGAPLPARLAALVQSLLAKRPDERPASPAAVLALLDDEALLDHAPAEASTGTWGGDETWDSEHVGVALAPPAPVPTATSEATPPARSRRWMLPAAALVAAALGAGAWSLTTSSQTAAAPKSGQMEARALAALVPPPAPNPRPTPAPAPDPKPTKAPVPAPTPETVEVQLTSTPSAAEVEVAGREGKLETPAVLELAADAAPLEVTLRRHGRVAQTLSVRPDGPSTVHVELPPRAARQPKPKPEGASTGTGEREREYTPRRPFNR